MVDARVPHRNPRTAYRVVNERGLLVVMDNRELHTLNAVGARVWSLCDGREIPEIVETIVREFEVDLERARTDVDAFLSQLDTIGALEWGAP